MADEMIVHGSAYRWTPWLQLEDALREPVVAATPGLYRIRRTGRDDVDYIGQTGGSLRGRVRMLAGIYRDEMPYRDPHTAAPALWALLRKEGCVFEVSVLEVEGEPPWRKGLEAVAIALHRQETGRSPTVSFGRMPSGYRISSANNARLVAAGKRFRGGPTDAVDASHLAGVTPVGPLAGEPQSRRWGGHDWRDWFALGDYRQAPAGDGLYRIRGRGDGLVYIGEGRIRARLAAHQAKTLAVQATKPQAVALLEHGPLEFSAVEGPWAKHQRLELETDLIAAHILELGRVPPAQFIG